MPASYVYALGRIEPHFPRLSVEKEFAQATGRAETANLTDRQALRRVLEPLGAREQKGDAAPFRSLGSSRELRPVRRPAPG